MVHRRRRTISKARLTTLKGLAKNFQAAIQIGGAMAGGAWVQGADWIQHDRAGQTDRLTLSAAKLRKLGKFF